jgi:HSP20 family molecular chaperone IbpA
MTILKYNNDVGPLSPERALRQLPALFNDHWLDGLFGQIDRAFDVPNAVYPYNILRVRDSKTQETKHYEVEVALAGVGKEAIEVKVKDGQLLIDVSPANEVSTEDAEQEYLRKGISQRKGNLTFNLDKKVNVKKISSSYKDGLLKVTIPLLKPELINIDVAVE